MHLGETFLEKVHFPETEKKNKTIAFYKLDHICTILWLAHCLELHQAMVWLSYVSANGRTESHFLGPHVES